MKKKTWIKLGLLVVAVGGLVHFLQPMGFNLLNWFGSVSPWVQGLVGLGTIIYAVMTFKNLK